MKKLFLFATVVAAGLFTGCSSTDDAISEAANNPTDDVESNASQAIKINISSPVTVETRGTGTVGGVTGSVPAISNVWAGQTIRAFMFTKGIDAVAAQDAVLYADAAEYNAAKGTELSDDAFAALDASEKIKTPATSASDADPYATTFNLTNVGTTTTPYYYYNREMITPGSTGNLITPGYPGGIPDATESVDTDGKGEAMNADYSIQYYPIEGYFDFFGYYPGGVGAGNAAVDPDAAINTSNANKWTVPFTIDGTHDLMSTKAVPTNAEITALGDGHSNDFYCARAARKGVHPTLTFKHLLTRLSFKAIAGSNDAAGYTPAHNDVTEGVTPAAKTDAINNDGCQESEFAIETYDMTGASITNEVYGGLSGEAQANWNATADAHTWAGATSTITKAAYDALAITITGAVVATYTHTHPVAAGTDETNAVKVKSIKIWSKNSGNLAVAWKGDNDDITEYSMAAISPAEYAQIATDGTGEFAGNQANWTADDQDNPTLYTYKNNGVATPAEYAAMSPTEQGKATSVQGNAMTDAKKIVWGTSSDWLTLKARPYAKKKTGAAAAAYTDFTDGATLNQAVIDAQTALTNAQNEYNDAVTALEAINQNDNPEGYAAQELVVAAKLTAKNDAQTAKTDADDALQDLLDLETETISKDIFDKLTTGVDGGQSKYDIFTGNEALKENLIDLTPVAAKIAPAGAQVGEALIVAPKDGDYVMEVTIQQRVITNWKTPTQPTYDNKETTFRLNIKKPDGGFKINNSYEIQLTVYSFQRIEVITKITPWVVDASDIDLGQD